MKLRTAYFCRKCDEELELKQVTEERICSECGFTGDAQSDFSIVYAWKVEVVLQPFIPFRSLDDIGIRWGDSCPIEKTKTVSKKRRRISNR